MKNSEILAAIANIEQQLAGLKAMLNENEVVDTTVVESVVVEPAEELPAPPEVVVIPELVEPETTEVHVIPTYTHQEEVMYSNQILLKKNFTDWCMGRVSYINIHLKVLEPKEPGQKPYVLWKQGIYEIDAFDGDGNMVGTSPQFKIDSLGQEIVMFLRRVGFGGYEKKTYQPKKCLLCCD